MYLVPYMCPCTCGSQWLKPFPLSWGAGGGTCVHSVCPAKCLLSSPLSTCSMPLTSVPDTCLVLPLRESVLMEPMVHGNLVAAASNNGQEKSRLGQICVFSLAY